MLRKTMFIFVLVLGVCLFANLGWSYWDAVRETDNHDAGFAPVAEWGTESTPILFYGDDFRWAACSGGAAITRTATFNARASTDTTGFYSVYVRHVVHPNRTTAAKFKIYDGADYRGLCTINQQTKGGEWRYCGVYAFTEGRIPSIILGNDCEAGKFVVADAVRWVKENWDFNDILDEPGIEYASASNRDVSTMPTNCAALMNLTSINVLAPAEGYIHVQASGIYAPGTSYRWVRVGLDDASGGGSFSGWAPFLESWTNSANAYANEKRYALSRVFYVSASGNYTFYLKGCREDGATGNLMWNDFTGVYYRKRY